jgi:multisubunit Na+/H+ antiporter MnhC subunit
MVKVFLVRPRSRTSTPKLKPPPLSKSPQSLTTTLDTITQAMIMTTIMARGRLSTLVMTRRTMRKTMEKRLMLRVLRIRISNWS